MSYCRWSSDDYQSDVYVYEHCDGFWATHVAGRRYVFTGPLPPPLPSGASSDEWLARHRIVSAMLDSETMQDIGLPHDEETFNDPTPAACADRLESLRALGYRVPQYAIDELRAEAAEA